MGVFLTSTKHKSNSKCCGTPDITFRHAVPQRFGKISKTVTAQFPKQVTHNITKSKARSIVLDRAPMKYPKSVVTVLVALVELTHVHEHRTDDIENFHSRPMSLSRLASRCNLTERTVKKALARLVADNAIRPEPLMPGAYSLNPDTIKMFESKYRSKRNEKLEHKILSAVRMKLKRTAAKAVVIAPKKITDPKKMLPETCALCEGPCQYPPTSMGPLWSDSHTAKNCKCEMAYADGTKLGFCSYPNAENVREYGVPPPSPLVAPEIRL